MIRLQPLSWRVLRDRYLAAQEQGIEDVQARVAKAIASVETPGKRRYWEQQFLAAMERGLIPGGRINASAGLLPPGNLVNCFVQPLRHGAGRHGPIRHLSIAEAIEQAQATMRAGGGIGYDLGELGIADPLAALKRLDQACDPTRMGPRGCAQMGLLAIDHPRILDFIAAKVRSSLPSFNLSVTIDDRFMRRLRQGCMREGIDGAGLRRDTEVWRTLLEAMWANSQPGIIFIDRVNRDNNLAAIERLSACNPCAEQYLPAYGACNLASINLARLVCAPFTRQAAFDWPAFDGLVAIGVRLLDNVLTLNRWPLREQALEAESKRRIGLGFTGLADALCMLGLRYDGEAARITAALIARRLRDRAYECSIDLAVERGAYPRFEARSQLRSPSFSSRLPEALKRRISRFGLRNSHLLCVAPTGSISIAFGDNCSTGIEPIFRARYRRWVRGIGGERSPFEAENHAARRWRETFPNGSELPPAWCDSSGVDPTDQLRMVGAIQDFIDSGISKTVQLPQDYDQHRLEALVWLAWHRGLKGFTVYRPRHWQEGVLQSNA